MSGRNKALNAVDAFIRSKSFTTWLAVVSSHMISPSSHPHPLSLYGSSGRLEQERSLQSSGPQGHLQG
jgi:hypothetical protein